MKKSVNFNIFSKLTVFGNVIVMFPILGLDSGSDCTGAWSLLTLTFYSSYRGSRVQFQVSPPDVVGGM